jgi:hypothetical protein
VGRDPGDDLDRDAALAAIAAWNLATYGLLWMSATPGLGFGRAMVMTQAASAGFP